MTKQQEDFIEKENNKIKEERGFFDKCIECENEDILKTLTKEELCKMFLRYGRNTYGYTYNR